MHILCAYTDQKLAQQGQKNSTSVFTALTTFRISDLETLRLSNLCLWTLRASKVSMAHSWDTTYDQLLDFLQKRGLAIVTGTCHMLPTLTCPLFEIAKALGK